VNDFSFTALKTKNPTLSCWVLFVTPEVKKSNFYEDLEGVREFTFPS
jgi:hypothetical protein